MYFSHTNRQFYFTTINQGIYTHTHTLTYIQCAMNALEILPKHRAFAYKTQRKAERPFWHTQKPRDIRARIQQCERILFLCFWL